MNGSTMPLASWWDGICEFRSTIRECIAFANIVYSFFYEALLVPFEISAFVLVLSFWSDKATEPGPTVGIIIGVIACYA